MSYQLYVTGGHGFNETLLPSLLHPSEAVELVRAFFDRGYKGYYVDLPPDSFDYPRNGKLTDRQKQGVIEDVQAGRLVLSQVFGAAKYALFTERKVSPDTLKDDLPSHLQQRLKQQWSGGGYGGAYRRSDTLESAIEPNYTPEPLVEPKGPEPGTGDYSLTIAYHWEDGTGVADMPFKLYTEVGGEDYVEGTLNAQGEATVEDLHGRFAMLRIGPEAQEDIRVRKAREGILHMLGEILAQERRNTEVLEKEYSQLAWYERPVVSGGALFQGAADAGLGLLNFLDSMVDLTSPTQRLMDGLNAAWAANENGFDRRWYDTFKAEYDQARHEKWVKAIGFDPSDISQDDVAEAYELANLVMADAGLRQGLTDFMEEFVKIQHHTEITYFTGSIAFDLVLVALLAVITGGTAPVLAGASRFRYPRQMGTLGQFFRNFGESLRKQHLRRVWRRQDLKADNHFQATAPKRVKGQNLKAADPVKAVAAKRLLVNSFEEAVAALKASRKKIIANGRPPPPKYTQAELAHIAKQGVAEEKYVVRLVQEPHVHRGGEHMGTLGKEGVAGVQVWSTTLDQVEHLDTDPRLISQALGVDYKPDANYKLAIVDQAEAVKHADAEAIVPTYDNLSGFVQGKLPDKVENAGLASKVMTPEYSRQYEALARDMPDSAWKEADRRELYLSSKGLDQSERKLFETRLSIEKNTGANAHFTGNGLTKTTSSSTEKPVYGAVETFSLHKNPKTFRQMMGMDGDTRWVELVDLNPIELGN